MERVGLDLPLYFDFLVQPVLSSSQTHSFSLTSSTRRSYSKGGALTKTILFGLLASKFAFFFS